MEAERHNEEAERASMLRQDRRSEREYIRQRKKEREDENGERIWMAEAELFERRRVDEEQRRVAEEARRRRNKRGIEFFLDAFGL